MITSRGASDHLNLSEIKPILNKILTSDIVYFTGYSFISASNQKALDSEVEVWLNPGGYYFSTPCLYLNY